MSTLTVMRQAFLAGVADYKSMYTPKSWLFGWLVRVLAQVSFFAIIGERLGNDEDVTFYLLVGNALAIAAVTGVFSLNTTSSERWAGTLSLLVASPSNPVIVFGSRGAYHAIDGAVSALSALFIAGPLFGMELPWPRVLLVVPLTMLVGYACYCLGTFLAGIVFRFRGINSFVVLTTYMTIMAVCGVNVPLDYYPEALEWISRFVPLTNGLLSIRAVFDGDPGSTILGYAALEAAVAVGWMTAGLLTFNRLLTRGRQDGTLDFGA